jgi:hypothetical protein
MNAYELADFIENFYHNFNLSKEAANMLRLQADKIEQLKRGKKILEDKIIDSQLEDQSRESQ